MVGLVLVSHSKKLAEAVRELVLQMTAPDFPIAVASGVGENHDELGTDAVHIAEILQKMPNADGVLVLMDLGSAVLSAQTALELMESAPPDRIRLCAGPLVEGAIAAAVRASAGGSLAEVLREAQQGLGPKQEQLQPEPSQPVAGPTFSPAVSSGETAELVLVVDNEHGLHVRPAAELVRTLSKFSSNVEISNMTSRRGPANARSLTSLALLQVRKGDRIRVCVSGPDRDAALRAIAELAREGFGEGVTSAKSSSLSDPVKDGTVGRGRTDGTPASDGIAIGPLVLLQNSLVTRDDGATGAPADEIAKLTAAIREVSQQLSPGKATKADRPAPAAIEILEAQALILSDPVLLQNVSDTIETKRESAIRAWTEATESLAAQYESLEDAYLRERAADIRDIAGMVVRKLGGTAAAARIQLDSPAILLTHELLPSQAAACDPATVLGVITRQGSATSHSAIILRTVGIPMVVGVTWIDEAAARGKTVAMDGHTGEVWIEPDNKVVAGLEARKREQVEQQRQAAATRGEPSITLEGARVEVLANVANVADAEGAAANGAEGVGLLRTEFLFLSRSEAPSEEEQVRALREVVAPIRGPVVVRTLDVGADKPLAFLPTAQERNPFLGMRGIRLSLRSPELFAAHLRAILRAGVQHDLRLMFPMVSTLDEVRQARDLLEQAHQDLAGQAQSHAWPIKLGVMIEVPSAALLSERLAEEVDFFSIGTNDLTQYVMAAERGNPAVSEFQDGLHPAVLRLITTVVDGARSRDLHVSVCGDAASDPLAAAIFVGLGIRSLSVRPRQVPEIKALFRTLRLADLRNLADQALQASEAAEVRRVARECLASINQPKTASKDQPVVISEI